MEEDSTSNEENRPEPGTSLGSKTKIKGVKPYSLKPKIKVSIKKLTEMKKPKKWNQN